MNLQLSKEDIKTIVSARKALQKLEDLFGSYEPKLSSKKLAAFTKFDAIYEGGAGVRKPNHLKVKK
jgi:hypothetical protein